MTILRTLLFAFLLIVLAGTTAQAQDDQSVWANYDFVPGDTILFYHDFEGARVGNFPSRIEYLGGSMEVVELPDSNKVLRTQNEGRFEIPLPEMFPERYTIEYRIRTSDKLNRIMVMLYSGADKPPLKRPGSIPVVQVNGRDGAGLTVGRYTDGPKAVSAIDPEATVDQWANIRVSVDGPYWKVYFNEQRVSNIPRVDFPAANTLRFYMSIYPYDNVDVYIDEIRVAKGGPRSLYDDLMAEGHIITQGIYFDVNSPEIKPESTPTLLQLETMMQEHDDLDIRIEGHTDSTGTDAINTPLSEARATSVRQWLIDQGIAEDRMSAQGLGATRPVADNTTSEGRAQNRRTEVWLRDAGTND